MTESEWPNGRDRCLGCGRGLPVDRSSEPCPACGADVRAHRAFAGVATAEARASHPGTKVGEPHPDYHDGRLRKPARERTIKFEVTAEDGVERRVTRSIDRHGDVYEETIYEPDGTIYRHVQEPLSDYRGHGSARPSDR